MGSQQERAMSSYTQWSPQETKTLIQSLLECVAAGLRDSNGTFSKHIQIIKSFVIETFEDFDDLKVIFEKNVASGKSAIGLGNTTDARTCGISETGKEKTNDGEEFSINVEEDYETPSSFFCSSSMDTLEKLPVRKRQRNSLNKVDPIICPEVADEACTEVNALTTITHKLFDLIQFYHYNFDVPNVCV
ncbi:unnamed protein product [Thlaspi arvense]|uniref:Uncharacterized protein n=1 Tax=Thlaspi arvense TaxID=13288 RepID=A0AAU9SS44_THLAR|nr:unnamed protein product [Thlaspi arvense]